MQVVNSQQWPHHLVRLDPQGVGYDARDITGGEGFLLLLEGYVARGVSDHEFLSVAGTCKYPTKCSFS